MLRILPLAAGLALAVPAAASAAPIAAGGTTELSFTSAAAKALKGAGVKAAPVGVKALSSGAIPFPITRASSTAIAHTGGLKLSKGGKSITLSNFRIVLKKGVPTSITASAGSARVKAFDLDARRTKTTTDGYDTTVGPVSVRLSSVATRALSGAIGVRLPTGYRLANATVKLQTAATRVTLDPATAEALKKLAVSVAPEGDAKAGSTIQFPITNAGGKISTKANITHGGGLTFSAGGKTLTVGDFTIDPVAGLLYAERSPVGRLPLFKVDLSGATIATPGIQVDITGAKLSLTAAAAGALNSTFGVTAFTENLAIGTAQVVGLA